MRSWKIGLLMVLLFAVLTMPVLADDGEDQVVLFGEDVVVGPDGPINGSLIVVGGDARVLSGARVRGDLVVIGGEADVRGWVGGSLVGVGGTMRLSSGSVVDGDLVTFASDVIRESGSQVRGQRIEGPRWQLPQVRDWRWMPIPEWTVTRESGSGWILDMFGDLLRWVLRTLVLMGFGALVVLMVPLPAEAVARTVRGFPVASAGVGLLTFVALLLVIPLLVVICIGIPLVLVLVVGVVAAQLMGRAAVGWVIGDRLLAALKIPKPQPLLTVVVGIAAVELVGAVPCLGWLLGIAVSFIGLGAVALTRFGTVAYPHASSRATQQTELIAPESTEIEETE